MAFDDHSTKRYIYLADDDIDDSDLFADALLEAEPGTVLKQFEDGMYLMDALFALSHTDLPEIIFLDINMPRKSGLECLQEIRNHKNLNDVPVIMLSTSNDPQNINKALEMGAALYAVKPSSYQKLKSILEDVLNMNLVGTSEEKRKFLLV